MPVYANLGKNSEDVAELADALNRSHRATGSITLPAEALARIIRGLGYRKEVKK